ncbi:single-stranded DNA-binding protein [Kitasatospora sp. RB6PN24]|uniref:single-stranded DNA-binding protein n=1 Tax=Kitasatospora humi TaxID=2893891 RepID=UPI001E3C91AD|nr:single-stranded DNA-binding protein [Kitasatospora humi]MCC9309104.1 single-stranded DNA-binding protein [Kitasatospora humi]
MTTTLIGRVTRDPKLHRLPDSVVDKVTFTLEQRPPLATKGRSRKASEPLFIRCVAWRGLARTIAATLAHDSRVVVVGDLVQHQICAEGQPPRQMIELEVTAIGQLLRPEPPGACAPAAEQP